MVTRFRLAVYTAIFAFCSISMGGIKPASAATPGALYQAGQVERIQVNGWDIPWQRLAVIVGAPGETRDAFALQVAPMLRAYTAAHGVEACGEIAQGRGRFGVVVGTSQGHTMCPVRTEKVPPGMTATGQTIHSHTTMRRFRINGTDLALLGVGHRVGEWQGAADPDVFSDEDYAAPGYLVGPGGVWHQDGKPSTVRQVVTGWEASSK